MKLATTIGMLALVAATSACGSGADAKGASTTATVAATTSTTAKKLNPDYDTGAAVTITKTGFQPKTLIAVTDVPLTFTNETTVVQTVQFEHSRGADGQLIRSAPIAPGKSWSYTPHNWESATYHSIEQPALRGQIQIQPPAEP
jgi:hypothetical protein